jgi:hypothetical protein
MLDSNCCPQNLAVAGHARVRQSSCFMVDAGPGSLRFSRSDQERLLVALAFSILVHLLIWVGFEIGKKYDLWHRLHMPSWRHELAKNFQPPPPQQETQPTIFVDVVQSDPTPPKKTIYYSDKNSHAANPDEDKNSNQPKLNGKQTEIVKTEDTPRLSKAQPPAEQAQPLRPSPQPAQQPADESSPMNLGDQKLKQLAMKKTTSQTQEQPKPRPRTLKEAAEQNHLPGLQMQQDGGARHSLVPSLDVTSTVTGDYDSAVIYAIQSRWDSLLDQQRFADDRTGRVEVQFKLEYDGSVRDVKIVDNNVGDVLSYICQAAIEDAAPFGKWPDDMRREIGANYREIKFTFIYY